MADPAFKEVKITPPSSHSGTLQRLQQSQIPISDDQFLLTYHVFKKINFTPPSSGIKTSKSLQQSQLSLDDEFILTHPVFKEFNVTLPVDKKTVHLLVIVTTGPRSQCKIQIRDWLKL